VRKGDDLTTFIVPKVVKNPEALTFRTPKGLLRPVAGKLYLYVHTGYYYKWFGNLLIAIFREHIYIYIYIYIYTHTYIHTRKYMELIYSESPHHPTVSHYDR
jgi:hypothetical protein